MAHVGEISLFRSDALGHHEGFGQGEVGYVLVFLKGVEHQHLRAFELREGFVRNEVRVGDVAEITDAEAEHGKLQVLHRQGSNGDAVDGERCVVDFDQVQLRDSGIAHGFEGVAELALQLGEGVRVAVHGHVVALHEIVCPHVVEAGGVVFMSVGKEDGIQSGHPFAQHLLSEVGTRVDHHAGAVEVEVDGGAKSLVAVVQGTADFAGASDNGYAL